ncbi:MAG: ATP-binding protein [Oscillospiraceae bacterium]
MSIDPALAENLVLNLISNSLTHAAGCPSACVSCIASGFVISVNDDGCGIAPDKLHFVFDRYRHGFGISDIDHGAGLGLTAALAIANLHGGTLLLESREGSGTTVRASFSRNPVPHAAALCRAGGIGAGYAHPADRPCQLPAG